MPQGAAALLAGTTVEIADLSGAELGRTTSKAVEMDATADGYGWFVDATPGQNHEFRGRAGAGGLGATLPAAASRMHLLAVVLHEIGHELGRTDLPGPGSSGDRMQESLEPAVRLLSGRDAAGTRAIRTERR